MALTDSISIYRNRRTGRLRIQPFGRLTNGSAQPFGEAVLLPEGATDAMVLEAILENLAKNNQQAYDERLLVKVPEDEWKRELREDQLIHVKRQGTACRVIPSRRMRNSFGSIDDMIQSVSSEEFLRTGGEIVRRLFEEIP